MIKQFYFRRTQRGGRGKNSQVGSRISAIALWLLRRIVWCTGITFKDIVASLKVNEEVGEEETQQEQQHDESDTSTVEYDDVSDDRDSEDSDAEYLVY